MTVLRRLSSAASDAGGAALAGAVAGLDAVRRARKPLHPRGQVVPARLHRRGADPTIGVAWLDEAGEDEVLARISKAIGLPGRLPDIQGLALRVDPHGSRPGDLLFATTGWGRLSRFVLVPRRDLDCPMTTLLPYRTPVGPVELGARRVDATTLELSYAVGAGRWTAFADLLLPAPGPSALPADPEISFDPLVNRVPGLEPYDWVRRLREPGYARARLDRS